MTATVKFGSFIVRISLRESLGRFFRAPFTNKGRIPRFRLLHKPYQ